MNKICHQQVTTACGTSQKIPRHRSKSHEMYCTVLLLYPNNAGSLRQLFISASCTYSIS